MRVHVFGQCVECRLNGLQRKQVLSADWVPPNGAEVSQNVGFIPKGGKVLSISLQGVDPDASEGSSAPDGSPPGRVKPDAAKGFSAPEVGLFYDPVMFCVYMSITRAPQILVLY